MRSDGKKITLRLTKGPAQRPGPGTPEGREWMESSLQSPFVRGACRRPGAFSAPASWTHRQAAARLGEASPTFRGCCAGVPGCQEMRAVNDKTRQGDCRVSGEEASRERVGSGGAAPALHGHDLGLHVALELPERDRLAVENHVGRQPAVLEDLVVGEAAHDDDV